MQKTCIFRAVFILLIGIIYLIPIQNSHAIIYVDVDATGSGNGNSWANAYNTIQKGLADADAATTDIWVAEGAYTGTVSIITSSVEIYGGFEGYGGAEETERIMRNWVDNDTIITGSNPYHVVVIDSVTTTVLDGFTITGGFAVGTGYPNWSGGGIYVAFSDNSNAIANCIITDNFATWHGGGVECRDSSARFINCTIKNNSTNHVGGGIDCYYNSPEFINCIINNNTTDGNGGGVFCEISSPYLTNCTFSENTANVDGAAVYCYNGSYPKIKNAIFADNANKAAIYESSGSDVSLANCLFYGNDNGALYNRNNAHTYLDIEMELMNAEVPEATGNINGDPMFVNKGAGDFHLTPCSAAIDEGTSDTAPLDDFDGNPRPIDFPGRGRDGAGEGFDIGAFELLVGNPQIDVSPTNIDFGQQSVNHGPTSSQGVTIYNGGSASLQFSNISLGDTTNFNFAASPDTTDLGICLSRTIDVAFDPASIGIFTTTLEIVTNDLISPTISVELQGEGLNLPPEAVICDDAVPYALDFNGSSDYVDCGDDESLMPESGITVEAWIKADVWRYSVYRGTIVDKSEWPYLGNQTRERGFSLRAGRYSGDSTTQGRAEFQIGNDKQDWVTVTSDSGLQLGQWYHIAGVYDGNNVQVYIDGVLADSAEDGADSGIAHSHGDLRIGECAYSTNRKFNGIIDEVRVWDYGKSQTQIQESMNEILDGNEPGLMGYWRFDEGTGNTAYDSTGNNNDGALVGMPDWTSDVPDFHNYVGFMTADENTDTTVTLCGDDPDDDILTAWITRLPKPGTGTLYQFDGVGPVRGALIDTTPTLVTDPDLRVVFVPVDTPINYNSSLKWIVNDGFVDSANDAMLIIGVLDNDPPVVDLNIPSICPKGDTVIITSDTLYSTDYEDIPENIMYSITRRTTHGRMYLGAMSLGNGDTFTQADIDSGLLSYTHNSIGMDPDWFNFDLMDGAGLMSGIYTHTIDIMFTPAAQVYVDLNSPGPVLDGGSWASAHHSIDTGVLDAAALGITEVWVADGTYMEEVDMLSGIHALAGFEGYGGAEETMESQRDWIANVCIIMGTGDRTVTMNDITNSLIHGFVISGQGVSADNTDSSNAITSCTITNNTAQFGGGINLHHSSPMIVDCEITSNTATREGGGIYCRNSSHPRIERCSIINNSADEVGGGIYCRNDASPFIVNCVIASNTAMQGAGVYTRNAAFPIIMNSTISGNIASAEGGGIFCETGAGPIAVNTILEDNSNFAVYEGDENSEAYVMNCLFYNNPDGAFHNNDGTDYMDEDVDDLNDEIAEASNNIMGDPQFADKEAWDFHIKACSAAVDQGAPNMAPSEDKDMNPRPIDIPGVGIDGAGEGFDIGAYELQILGQKISANPLIVDFGSQLVNQGPTDPQYITIINEGTEVLSIIGIDFAGSNSFILTDPIDESDMDICEERMIGVVFDPDQIGPLTATLTIESGDPDEPVIIVDISGVGVNTPPVAGVPGPGGDQFVANTDEDTAIAISVTGYDDDGDDLTAWLTQIPDLGKGAIHQYQGPGPIPGARITTVPTQVTDPEWRLVYVPDGAIAPYDAIVKWKMNDGYEDSLNEGTYTIEVQADDDPAILVNSSMTIVEGATEIVTPANLLATGDFPVSFRIDSLPSFGDLLLNSAPLAINDTFMQDDIALGFVEYAHDGSEEASDEFVFSFKDLNSDWITTNTFTIAVTLVNDPPVLAWNRSLLVDEGGIGAILQIHLLVEDPDNTPAEIIYTVGTFPSNGDLYLDGSLMSSGGIKTFTQADIDAGLLSYMHNGGSMDPDEFTFTFTDGEFNLGPDTFLINISFPDRKGAWWLMR